jgi:hypothetical protein
MAPIGKFRQSHRGPLARRRLSARCDTPLRSTAASALPSARCMPRARRRTPAQSPLRAPSVDSVATEWLADTDAPSVSVAIVQHGALVYAKAYGQAVESPSSSRNRCDALRLGLGVQGVHRDCHSHARGTGQIVPGRSAAQMVSQPGRGRRRDAAPGAQPHQRPARLLAAGLRDTGNDHGPPPPRALSTSGCKGRWISSRVPSGNIPIPASSWPPRWCSASRAKTCSPSCSTRSLLPQA